MDVPGSGPRTGFTGPGVPPEIAVAPASARFGKFVTTARLGAGGMGEVWKAWDTGLHRWVALKFLKGGDDEEVLRFAREAQIAGKLSHPNIAAIYDVGSEQGRHYIAMQFVDGVTLKRFPADDRDALVRVVRDAALALQFAHEQGVVHRDVKPENLMVTSRAKPSTHPHVYVMDFGLARAVRGDSSLTVSGAIVGTPAYMPPEQAAGELRLVGPGSDVYSLGATLYDRLTGRPPFTGDSPMAVILRVTRDDPPRPRALDPAIPPDLETIVLKCLEKEPERRYATAGELADDLGRYLDGEAVAARPASLVYRARRKISRHKALTAALVLGAVSVLSLAILVPALARRSRAESTLRLWQQVSAVLAKADAHARVGDVTKAHAVIDDGLAMCGATPDTAERCYFEGRLWSAKSNAVQAGAAFDRALRARPDFPEARIARGLLRHDEFSRLVSLLFPRTDSGYGNRLDDVPPALLELRNAAMADLESSGGVSAYALEADRLVARGHMKLIQDDPDAAKADFDRTLAIDPLNIRAQLGLAAVARTRRAPAEALALTTTAIERHRGSAHAYFLRAELQLILSAADGVPRAERDRRIAEAAADVDLAMKLAPVTANVLVSRARVRSAQGDEDGAFADYTEAIGLDARAVAALINRALIHHHRGHHDDAIRDCDAALKQNPRFVAAYINRANARQARGDAAGAIADCDAALVIQADYVAAFVTRAMARKSRGDRDGALDDLMTALRIDPDCESAYVNRSAIRNSAGDAKGAVADCDEAIRRIPASWKARLNRASAKLKLKDFDGAIADCDAALRLQPDLEMALTNRAAARFGKGDTDGTIRDAEEALRVNPRSVSARLHLADAFAAKQDLARARAALDAAIDLDPGNEYALLHRAAIRASQGDVPGGVADLDEALNHHPGSTLVLYNRGVIQMMRKRIDEAFADFDEVLRLDERHWAALTNRGVIRCSRGDRAGGLADLEKALGLVDEEPDRRRIRAAIDNFRK